MEIASKSNPGKQLYIYMDAHAIEPEKERQDEPEKERQDEPKTFQLSLQLQHKVLGKVGYTDIYPITTIYHNIINKLCNWINMPNYPGRRLLDKGTRLYVEKVAEFNHSVPPSGQIDYWGLAHELNADHSRMVANDRVDSYSGWVKLGDNKNWSNCCQQFYVTEGCEGD